MWAQIGDSMGGLAVLTGVWLTLFPIIEKGSVVAVRERIKKSIRYVTEGLRERAILRSYQAAAITAALSAPWSRGIIKIPTGGGKTRICVGLVVVGSLIMGIRKWIYLVCNQQLAQQTQKEFDGIGHTMFEAMGLEVEIENRIQCLSYGKVDLQKVKAWAESTRLGIIVDECHGISARTRAEVLLQLGAIGTVGAVVGLSATPLDRSDEKNALIAGLIGPIVFEITMDELVSRGYLARGKVVIHPL